jgi:hypothetical protein
MSQLRNRLIPAFRLAAVAALSISALALGALPAGAAPVPAQPCEQGAPLVDVVYQVLNEQDLTSTGDVWALDSARSQFRLYRTGRTTFCASVIVEGSFTAFGGPSPAGTGTVPAGQTGRFVGFDTVYLTGTFVPQLPTHGFVGTFDAQCDQFECQNDIRFGRNYVQVTKAPTHGAYSWRYTSPCGVWTASSAGDGGDIAC